MEVLLRKKVITICAALLFLTALGLTLYPPISNYVNRKYASEIQTAYQELIQQTDNSVLEEAKQQAIAYNLAITPGTADAYSEERLVSAAEDYDSQLDIAGNGIMGYVEIPKIQVNLPIYHGTEAEVLDRGVGHLLGSSLPVGGENTHTVLSGHSGMASQKMFTDLERWPTRSRKSTPYCPTKRTFWVLSPVRICVPSSPAHPTGSIRTGFWYGAPGFPMRKRLCWKKKLPAPNRLHLPGKQSICRGCSLAVLLPEVYLRLFSLRNG